MSTEATNQDAGEDLLPVDGVVEGGAEALDTETTEIEVELDDDGNPVVQPGPDEEVEEIEHDGQKYALPKALKPLLLMQADYTKKTQELGEQRRQFEEEAANQRKAFAEADQAEIQQRAKVVAIDDQLGTLDKDIAAFGNVDWDAALAQDRANGTDLVVRAQLQLQALKDARDKLGGEKTKISGEIETRSKTRALELQQATAKQLEERDAVLKAEFPTWSEERPAIDAFAKANGVTQAELDASPDPRIFRLLKYAKLGFEAEQRAKTAATTAARVQPATGAARPIVKVAGASTPKTDPNRMSTEQWMKHRREQVAKIGRR